jgi:hypothetical protein
VTSNIASAHDLGVAIVNALKLPPMVYRLELVADADEAVQLRTWSFVETDVKGELIKQLSEFRLVPKESV